MSALQIFPESLKQQASLIEGVFLPERALVQFWKLEQGVLVSHDLGFCMKMLSNNHLTDLRRAHTADGGSVAPVVKKVKLAQPFVFKHLSWQSVTKVVVVVELSRLLKSMLHTVLWCKVSSHGSAEAKLRKRSKRYMTGSSDRWRLNEAKNIQCTLRATCQASRHVCCLL